MKIIQPRKAVGNTLNQFPMADHTTLIMFTLKSYIPKLIWQSCIRVPAFLTLLRLRPSPGCDTKPNRVQTTKFSPHFHTFTTICLTQNFINTLEYMWIRWCLYTYPQWKSNNLKNDSKVEVYRPNFSKIFF